MIVPRVSIEEYNGGDLVDDAIEEALADKKITKRRDKADPATLNEEGRIVLAKHGASLDAAAQELAHILEHSKDEDLRFKVSKFLVERHAGKLEGSKDTNNNTIVLNFGEGRIDPNKPNIFNPTPINVTPVQE